MKRDVPWLTLLAVTVAVIVSRSPALTGLAVYDRDAVLSGDVWRLFTGHWVHFSRSHLLLDCLALAVAGSFVELRSRRLWLLFLAVAPWWIGGGLLRFDPALAVYGGMSGLVMGAVVLVILMLWRGPGGARTLAVLLGLFVMGKLAGEMNGMVWGARLPDGVAVSWGSHVLGAAGALLSASVLALAGGQDEQKAKRARPVGGGGPAPFAPRP